MSAEPIRTLVPLPEEQAGLLSRLVDGLDQSALIWLSGYTAGLAARAPSTAREAAPLAAVESAVSQQLTIVYGSQTGNAKRVAEKLARESEAAGLAVRLLRADAYPLRELKSERLLYVVISTQGDGDPPDDARGFVEFLAGKRAPRLENLEYAVLGLGDSSYAKFCAVGSNIDERLAELGGKRLFARGEADVDFDTIAQPWVARALSSAREALKTTSSPMAKVTALRPQRAPVAWSLERPYSAEVLVNQRITASTGSKDVRHLELALGDSGLTYEPGDSLGVWPSNPPALVDAITSALKLDPQQPVTHDAQTLPLRDWLLEKRELTRLARPFVFAHAQRARHDDLDAVVASPVAFLKMLFDYQTIDLLRAFPADWNAQDLVAALRPLQPRLYSIASSLKSVEDEAHLTVALVDYEAFGIRHTGAASHFLAGRDGGGRAPIFIEANERFRLPQDPSRDVIMIGPGTGVAPFRGFVQERSVVGAKGRNWLFFGNPHFHSDFLYQLEWQRALKRGELHRLDVAFSRDQRDKVYVQQRIRSKGRELYAWLESGAHLYVCGDASRMAIDVHAALRDVVVQHGGESVEDAEAHLQNLANERRYLRDIY
ncbi:MAG TPA: assimilatory sulfite reductase (NADPH) flavoprotein subunit [Rhodanobacteraceae bacterium]|nr:assimilatory sulfite reductase (NADPH) flavoprotein subunit [Rhodanobacteraceae bacterium]